MMSTQRFFRYIPLAFLLLLAASMLRASPGTEAYANGDLTQAATLLRDEVARDNDPAKQRLLGIIAMSQGEFKDAYERFEALSEAQPGDADLHYWLGASAGSLAANASLFRAAGYARKTRAAFLRAIELDPKHVAAHQGLISYYLQAPGMLGGDKDAAVALAERLSEFAPIDGALLQASVYADLNDDKRERAILERLADTHPDDPRALLRLGFHYQSEEDFARAHDFFSRAEGLSLADGDDERSRAARVAQLGAAYQVGRTAVFSGERIEAGIAALERYLRQPDLDASLASVHWARFRLGQLHRLAGNEAAAAAAFAQARDGNDDDTLLRELKKVGAGD